MDYWADAEHTFPIFSPGQTEVAGEILVQSIITNIVCELQDAVLYTYGGPEKARSRHLFLDKWGAQLSLTLTIEETSAANPTLGWFPNKIFALSVGAKSSADATRIDKISSYFTIEELKTRDYCDKFNRPGGPFMMASDLKLSEWLHDTVTATLVGSINYSDSEHTGPLKQEVLSHHIKFDVQYSGSLTPTWKLSRVLSVNPVGTFVSGSRDRTHDLVITFGPTSTEDSQEAGVAASNSALASDITVGVSNAFKSALQQQ